MGVAPTDSEAGWRAAQRLAHRLEATCNTPLTPTNRPLTHNPGTPLVLQFSLTPWCMRFPVRAVHMNRAMAAVSSQATTPPALALDVPPTTTPPVPLLVQVVAGNPATSAGVLLCLDTYDATILRQLHPVLMQTVAGVPWCDMNAAILDVRRWRAALPAAVGAWVAPQLRLDEPALLAGLTSLDVGGCGTVTDAVIQRLSPTLRHLDVAGCRNLTAAASFTHLRALTSLDCSYTAALDAGLGRLPPSLQVLAMDYSKVGKPPQLAASFYHLPALRVLSWQSAGLCDACAATLPPALQELNISNSRESVRTMSLAHLPRLRVVRAHCTSITDAAVAALPASLEELDVERCYEITPAVSFTHLRALRALCAVHTRFGDASLASLPPSLVTLDVSHCKQLSPAATLPGLPALQELGACNTGIGDAFVASLPPCVTSLRIANCINISPAADVRHLTALRELQCSGTHLPPSEVAALRARVLCTRRVGAASGSN